MPAMIEYTTMTEEIAVDIELSSTNWDKRYPGAKVYINDTLIFENLVVEPTKIHWQGTAQETNKITVQMYNKNPGDTVLDNEGNIVNDVVLNINSIAIDEIELDNLLWTHSVYYPDANQTSAPKSMQECVNLGWNGRWELQFDSPIYLWLLENL